ncbi:serine/threonine protein kinase BUD32 ASCRUDRAFT_71420 [Ascoidea rubescens DSM 1968]|uniref:EKC/KEOPS complex subunit BUD32 n=1 Tax=Ascoidea rubescens DSM 1968 TaxID=1344418 RepID=A0A1D2VE26_9ASCO|nr:hypothetical protein ASCRUDRAFT_71420 [Ascoidea rubescens DSM 1968]ODV59944.1 hypothetical protein ASCRUDRAFT_71420 [Ascoidea rubescens DSM 1968]
MSRDLIERKALLLLPHIPLLVVSQGAEAIIFQTSVHPYLPQLTSSDSIYIIKYRPSKPYRHPILDKQITKHRTLNESKLLLKLLSLSNSNDIINDGAVLTPSLIATDIPNGLIWLQFVGHFLNDPDGVNQKNFNNISSLKNYLWSIEKKIPLHIHSNLKEDDIISQSLEKSIISINYKIKNLLTLIGIEIANLHIFDICHGDLTSSNIILQKNSNYILKGINIDIENDTDTDGYLPYLIDFGLSFQSNLIEDKAVDLYLLEKAIISTHPLFANNYYNVWLLNGYKTGYQLKSKKLNNKSYINQHKTIIKRLDLVRLRGRKKSMIG